MVKAIRQEVIVQEDNVIEIHSLALKHGAHVEVILLLEEEPPKRANHLLSLLDAGKGSFASPDEVDAFIRGERNQWQ